MGILAVQGMQKKRHIPSGIFCLHSVKCTIEHNTGTDHKLSDTTGLSTIYGTQNIQEKDIP